MKIALASDHAGFEAKQQVYRHLTEQGHVVTDFGTFTNDSCDYPDFAAPAALSVAEGANNRAILICGTGIGMCIAANKINGIRCALVTCEFAAKATRSHNDANAIALGARITDLPTMLRLIDLFLTTPFEGGRHSRRIDKISALERK